MKLNVDMARQGSGVVSCAGDLISILGKRGSGSSDSEFGRNLPAPIRPSLTTLRHNSSRYMSSKLAYVYWYDLLFGLDPSGKFPECRIRFDVLDEVQHRASN